MEQHLLPNAESAWIPSPKLTEYLLSLTHEDGRSKAEFFMRFRFQRDNWRVLEQALLQQARSGMVVRVLPAPYGLHYEVKGRIAAPDGRTPLVTTVWIVEHGETAPRLVTAYPA